MKIGQRDFNIGQVIFDRRHYLSIFNIFRYCQKPLSFLKRYFLAKGDYPCLIEIKTPRGIIAPEIYSFFDSLTVNEIFFRLDYGSDTKAKVVIDIGSNIGISALYFLSRNNDARVYLYEPVPDNLIKLKNNLRAFTDRIVINEKAVFVESGVRQFGVEATGRFGGLSRQFDNYTQVDCISINEVIESVISQEGFIDILKIDIEGDEIEVVKAIDRKYLDRIKKIFLEIDASVEIGKNFHIFPDFFTEKIYGDIYVMENRLKS
jgi:FkbM family methyltransferase